MTSSPYLTEDDDDEHTEDDEHDNGLKLVVAGLAQNSLPHRPRHAVPSRALQEVSPNIQTDTSIRSRGPLLKRDVPCLYGRGPETQFTNRAGDFVLRHAQFYQLTAIQYRNYELLRARAIQVPKYEKYRKKELSGKTKGNQNVWGDVREELFFKALVKFPPMWRDQRPYPPYETPNKPYGRNEHIAFYINDILGAPKPKPKETVALPGQTLRKQVSSHLQVLKKYFEGRPDLLIWLGSNEKDKDDKPKRTISVNDRSSRRRPIGPYQLRRAHSASAKSLPDPLAILPSQGYHSAAGTLSAPAKFCMSLRTEVGHVHTFSQWQKNACSAYDLRDVNKGTWTHMFPLLENLMLEVGQDCRFIYAECALNLADGDLALANKILEFDYAYSCDKNTLKTDTFDVHTRFFDGINVVSEGQQDCTADPTTGNLDVGFFSKHWLQVLHKFCQSLKTAVDGQPGSLQEPEYLRKKHLAKAKAELERLLMQMSAIQKISHHQVNSEGIQTDKVAMAVYWKFSLTKQGEIGTTSFRELIPPPMRSLPDVWLSQDYISQATRDESSFGIIKDETTSFDSPFANMPYSYNTKRGDLIDFSYNNVDDPAGFQIYDAYNINEYNTGYDPRLYEAALMTGLPPPIDKVSTGSQEGDADIADLTRVGDMDMSMLDYTSLASNVDQHAPHGPLLGPGDGLGLSLGLADHLQLDAFDPGLVGTTSAQDESHHLQPGHFTELADGAHHICGSSYPAANGMTAVNIIDPFAQHNTADHEPTHFHHYHRCQPRLHLHPSSLIAQHSQKHAGATELDSPADLNTPKNLVLAQPWYPAAHYPHNDHHDTSLQHLAIPPRLARHDSDATIEADMSDLEDFSQGSGGQNSAGYSQDSAYSQEAAYSQDQDKQYLHQHFDGTPAESFQQSFHHENYAALDNVPRHLAVAELEGDHVMGQAHNEHENHLYGLAAVAAANAELDDGDWEMLHAPQAEGKENFAPAEHNAEQAIGEDQEGWELVA